MRDRGYLRLVILYGVYFIALGASSFGAVYLGGQGLSDAQIGIVLSVAPVAALVVQPIWGLAGDRAKLKKNTISLGFLLTGLTCFAVDRARGFWPILIVLIVLNAVQQGISPLMQTICIEYSENTKLGFGVIRLSGSVTYQLIILVLGFVMSGTMPGLYRLMGSIYLFCAVYGYLRTPAVEGHQHVREKRVSPLLLLRDKRIVFLLSMTFCGKVTNMFYVSFYNKYIQQTFQSNQIMSLLAFLAVLMEIPFLLFANRIMKKLKVTYWVLLGFALNAIRFIGIGATTSLPILILLQLPAVSVMACFEFYPALYMNSIAPKELLGSMQSLNTLITFGITQLLGTLLGGILADHFGLQSMFTVYGLFLLAVLALYSIPARKANMAWDAPEQPLGTPLF